MRNQSLWKGITIFSLALGIGTFTGDNFKEKEISENVSNEVQTVEKKNCRFADPNLKYRTLPLKNENYSAELLSDQKKIAKPKEKESDASEMQSDKKVETNKLNSEFKDQPAIKNKEEYSILLHKEICSK